MNTVFKVPNFNLTVILTIFFTLLKTKVVRSHSYSCGQEELVRCAQPLQVFTDGGLTFVASKKDLDVICPDLKEGLRCVHSYTNRCMTLSQKTHFNKLFHGTSTMVKELCSNGTYQTEYLKFAPCMREVVDQNEICFKRYQQTMDNLTRTREHQISNRIQKRNENAAVIEVSETEENNRHQEEQEEENGIKNVCCSFQEYVECSTHTMRRACGEEAASFSRGFLDRMSSSMIKMHCSEYIGQNDRCGFSSSSSIYSSSILALINLLFLFIYIVR